MNLARTIKFGFTKNRLELPISLILLITSRCNARCKFCFFKDRLNKGVDEFDLAEYEKLSLSLGKLVNIIVSGGEPFLREDLPEICQIFSINNSVEDIAIPTNGLSPERLNVVTQKILNICSSNIMISLSLDGTREIHDKFRGVKGSFDCVLESYYRLIELKKSFPSFRVHVTTVISKENYNYLTDLIAFVRKNMPDLNGHNFELVRSEKSTFSKLLPSIDKCLKFQNMYEKIIEENTNHFPISKFKSKLTNVVQKYKFELCLQILHQGRQTIPCYAGNLIGVVNEIGDVFLCELRNKVGNIRETDFYNVWHSDEANSQRKKIKEKACYCTHTCFQGKNVIYNPRLYPSILRHYVASARGEESDANE